MLLVTASVADRLVGCWLERDCLPVCRRSRPHTLLTSAMEQQTIQQPRSPTGGRTGQAPSHTINKVHAVLQRMQRFLYSKSTHCPHFVHHFFFFLRQTLFERHDGTVGPGCDTWIHLTMQFKEIHGRKKRKKRSSDINMGRSGSGCQKCHRGVQCNILQSFIDFICSIYLFIYL